MNQKSTKERAAILRCLVEGNSLRSTQRITGVSINTITKLLEDVGAACLAFQDCAMHNLYCNRLEIDEIWAFCGSKQRNVSEEHRGEFGYGDVWTWIAVDADTKLIPCWLVGPRNADACHEFMQDLASRLHEIVTPQITTDGYREYPWAVAKAFGTNVDYAMLMKEYGGTADVNGTARKYSPAEVSSIRKVPVYGKPEEELISTSYVERQNLTLRMNCRRFTRLTNAHSKKLANHIFATSLHFMYYNYGRKHKTLGKQTPAMAAGLTDHVWTLEEIIETVMGYEANLTSN